jgi:hypothetical protein
MTKAKLNNIEYQIADGSVFRSFYNETLDNGTAIISQVSKIVIKPYDDIEIYLSEQWLKFYVLDIVESVASFSPELYNYTITYVSRTVLYQKTILPNISHTVRLNQANKTINNKISEIMQDFGPRKRSGSSYALRFPLSSNLVSFLGNAVCPEFVLQQPTLFDLFNYLLASLNAIITINQNDQTDYILLTQKKNSLDKTQFSELISMTRGEDYATSLVSDLENVLNTSNQYVSDTGWITARSDSAAQIDTPDMIVKTQHPIYKIIKVEMNVLAEIEDVMFGDLPKESAFTSVNGVRAVRRTFDITKFVKEYSLYELLSEDGISGFSYEPNKKIWNLFYKIGSNFIGGWGRNEDWWIDLFNQTGTTYQSFTHILSGWVLGIAENKVKPQFDYNSRMPRIRIQYIPLTTTKMNVSKISSSYALDIMTQNNQRDQIVDFERFSKNQLQTVLRLGNEEITALKRYNISDTLPVLGDYFDDFILNSREVSYNDGHIIFKGIFSKDYVEKTMFTGVSARLRMFPLLTAGEAIPRNINLTIYCEVSFTEKLEIDFGNLTGLSGRNYANFILNSLGHSSSVVKYLNYSPPGKIIGGVFKSSYLIDESAEYFLEPATFVGYNIIAHTFNFQDNVSIGKKVYKTNVILGSVLLQDEIRYTDNNGELTSIRVKLLRNYNQEGLVSAFGLGVNRITRIRDLTVSPTVQITQSLPTYYNPGVGDVRQGFQDETENTIAKLPEVYNGFYNNATDTILDYTIPIYKDNREKLSITVQHEFCSDSPNVVIGPSMVLSAAVIRGFNERVNTRFRFSTTHTYRQYDQNGVGELRTAKSFDVVSGGIILIYNAIFSMISVAGSLSNVKSWAITDIDGNLIIGVNKPTTGDVPTTIFLNILKTRQPL